MKKVMGRPKIGTENAKGVMVAVRLTPPEARQIKEVIRQARQGKSEWIRKMDAENLACGGKWR